MAHLRCLVTGRVQGVGFRFFVQREARKLGLTGWVRNLPTGEVELEASGDRSDLEMLLRHLEQGPPLSRVDRVDVHWGEGQITSAETGGMHRF